VEPWFRKERKIMAERLHHDISEISFISWKTGEEPQPVRLPNGRIAFRFKSDIQDALSDFYNDRPVPVQQFVDAVRTIRSLIFKLKGRDCEREIKR
jgi:hypothetical protein